MCVETSMHTETFILRPLHYYITFPSKFLLDMIVDRFSDPL